METFIKKYIKSEDDLPKKDGDYFAHDKDTADWSLHVNFYAGTNPIKHNWIRGDFSYDNSLKKII